MMSSHLQQQPHWCLSPCTVASLTNEVVFLLLKKPAGAQEITDDIMTGSMTSKSFLVLFGVNVCLKTNSITINTFDA